MPTCDAIIDLSHFNPPVDFAKVQASGILGVFHKASQGLTFADTAYAGRRPLALAAGLLWGAYHFGTNAPGADQAGFFLSLAQPDSSTLLALDFESDPSGPSMSLPQARDFVTRVYAATGRWPGLYGGAYLKSVLAGSPDPVLSQCWLWLSQYGPEAVIPPGWPHWTIWQYTDGIVGPPPHLTPGAGACDRDLFNGTADDLRAFWSQPAAAPLPAPSPSS